MAQHFGPEPGSGRKLKSRPWDHQTPPINYLLRLEETTGSKRRGIKT